MISPLKNSAKAKPRWNRVYLDNRDANAYGQTAGGALTAVRPPLPARTDRHAARLGTRR